MKHYWANDGKPDENDDFAAVVDLENGKPPQIFKGKSHEEVSNKLMEAQMHASARINELKGLRKPDPAPARPETPKPLSADERFILAQDMQDPAKATGAVKRMIEAELGAPLEKLKERLDMADQKQTQQEIIAECNAFRAATPEYFHCEHNAKLIVNWLATQGFPITRNNCAIAFEELSAAGLMAEKAAAPVADPPPPGDQPDETVRERRTVASTGIRSGDSGQSPDSRTTAKPNKKQYTLEDIEKMPSNVYRAKMTGEPGFEEAVEKLYGGKAAAR